MNNLNFSEQGKDFEAQDTFVDTFLTWVLLFFFFFNVGPPKEDIFSGHPLYPIFQSTLHISITSLCLGVPSVSDLLILHDIKECFVTILKALQNKKNDIFVNESHLFTQGKTIVKDLHDNGTRTVYISNIKQ